MPSKQAPGDEAGSLTAGAKTTGREVDHHDLDAGSNKLLAFRVEEGTDTFYGWIDYTLSFNDIYSGYTFTVNAWAYNDVSGQGIIAGQNTAAGSQAVPGLGGLAALAIGAAGVRSRRQRTVA